ncbi:MAG: LuxR C-terminal-related transcriptional regulator, partial [Gordonibacter sp.]|uniref:LuxR C-terminal-related transcriptional regulator n=1 Tax=Gordonibacter sp. TaxID=1968902 RepID=UPI002FCC16FB
CQPMLYSQAFQLVQRLSPELLQLRMEGIRERCSRASEWFHDYGMQDEAAKYLLLASDFDYVANLTEATCSLSREDRRTPYLLWLCRIPSAEFARLPLLCMLSAWTYITNARVVDALRWIARFERSMQEPEHVGSLDPSIVEFSSKCLKMKCNAMEGRGKEALAQCDELLNSGYEIKPSLMSMIYQSLGEAYERIGDMAQAQEIYLQAQASASVDATMHQLLFNSFNFAEVQYYFGEFDDAREGCEKLLQSCPTDFALYGAVCALLARVLLERNEQERAAVLVERSLKRTSHYRHIDMYLEAKMAQTGCLTAKGDLSEAYEAIVEAILYGEQKAVPRAVLLHAYFLQAEIAARRRNLRDLLVIERKFTARVHEEDVHCQLLLLFVQALAKREKGDAVATLELLEDLVSRARKGRFVCVAVKALAVQAVVMRSVGDESRAYALLGELLALASRHGFVRSILDAGGPLRDLLRDYSTTRKAGAAVRSYVKSLLVEFERELPTSSSGIGGLGAFANDGADPLTPRELEILKLLNMGMTRKEISETLCISVNTAKKHLANIYSKLGANTREEVLGKCAANRALEHGTGPATVCRE